VSDHAAFLRAILDAPDEDGPRLVYADYLDERGDPRGGFVRGQVEGAARGGTPGRCPDDARCRAAESEDYLCPRHARERELWARHCREWVGLPDGGGYHPLEMWRPTPTSTAAGSWNG
jgi:uncharacterized protein (TIGR02996 family)